MAIQKIGNSGVVSETDSTWRADRASVRPLDPKTLGAYRKTLTTGVMAAGLAANAPVFSFRYGGTNLCVVHKVVFDGLGGIAAFTAGAASFRLFIARSFTASDTGGTAGTVAGNNAKLKTSYATSGVTDIRIASTAALVAGTRTLDTDPIGSVTFGLTATAGAGIAEANFIDSTGGLEHPLVLAQNEGFVVHATVPATGTWTGGFTVAWTEVPTTDY